jgi:hypothetical protein
MRMFAKMAALAAAVGILSAWAVAADPAGLTVPLKGLTKDNAAKVETALAKLDRDGFRCATCDYFTTKEGECPGCKTALVAEKAGILLKEVKIDTAKNLAIFGVASASGVRLTEIDAILKPTGVTIDRTQLTIAPFTRLTVTGIKSEEDGAAIEKAFTDAKLFDAVKANFDVDHAMGTLIVGGAKKAPTYDNIIATVEKAGSFKVSEVTWTTACPKCKEKGATHAGCMSCWEKGT